MQSENTKEKIHKKKKGRTWSEAAQMVSLSECYHGVN